MIVAAIVICSSLTYVVAGTVMAGFMHRVARKRHWDPDDWDWEVPPLYLCGLFWPLVGPVAALFWVGKKIIMKLIVPLALTVSGEADD